MEDTTEKIQIPKRALPKFLALAGGIAVAAFLAGFVPTWLSARTYRSELQEAKGRVTLDQLRISLGAAAIHARRGDYEIARQETSRFFTSLRKETDLGAESALNAAQRQRAAALFAERDELITLLARGDPASTDRLSDLYIAYGKAVQGRGAKGAPGTNGSERSRT